MRGTIRNCSTFLRQVARRVFSGSIMRIEASSLPAQSALGLAAACAIASLWFLQPDPLIPLGAAFFAALLVGAVAQPFVVCLAFVAFSFFRLHEAYPFLYPLQLPLLLGAATVASLCIHVFIVRSIRPFWPAELKWFGLFFVLATLGIALAYNREVSWTFWTTVYWKIALMTLAIAWYGVRKLTIVLVALSVLINAWGVYWGVTLGW